MLRYLNYQQAQSVYELLSDGQKRKAASSGVAAGLSLLNNTEPGDEYHFIPQPDTNGKMISGKELNYDYLLIDFWASWCTPCRAEHPNLISLYNRYKNRKFEILSVSLDENRDKWVEAIGKDQLAWPQVSDLKGMNANALAKYYSILYIPFNMLIDKQGKIVATNIKGKELSAKLATLLQ